MRWLDVSDGPIAVVDTLGPADAIETVEALVAEIVPGSTWAFLDALGARAGAQATQLAERLVARVGWQSVAGVATVAEHRPQLAWRPRNLLKEKTIAELSMAGDRLQRPLWMLSEPARLHVDEGYPLHQGCRLRLLEGPERLETGWWDDDGISRDYYTAQKPDGRRVWIFRNRTRESAWYLHGYFG